jgi:predicted Zn-ribbon and HTH transcriptional regulator
MKSTIYARVAEQIKDATDTYAAEHGMSLTAAVEDLLGRGLEAAGNEISTRAFETRTQELQNELARVHDAASTMESRLKQVLGRCECGHDLTGTDLLLTGLCPNCKRGVSSLLAGTVEGGSTLNRGDFAPFLAGIGVALALIVLAYASSQEKG